MESAKPIHQDGASISSSNIDQHQHLEPQLIEVVAFSLIMSVYSGCPLHWFLSDYVMSQEIRNYGTQTATIPAGSSGFGFSENIVMAPAYSPHMVPVIHCSFLLDAQSTTLLQTCLSVL